MELNINKKDKIHFIGIGGIGMSGIALILKKMGYDVQGSDTSKKNKNLISLKKNGIKLFYDHDKSNIKNSKIVVISTAIHASNIELKHAYKKNILVIKRADMLAHIISLKKKYCNFRISWKNHNHFFSFNDFKRCQFQAYNY